MNATRRAAILAGVLFFAGIGTGLLSVVGAADGPQYLRELAGHPNQVFAGAVFQSLMTLCYVGMAIVLSPVLAAHNRTATATFLGLRIAAGVLNLLGAVSLVLLLDLSRQFIAAGSPSHGYFQDLGELLRAGRDLINHVAMILALSLGDAFYYLILYRQRLVGRWLSVWGFLGLALSVLASFLVLGRIIPVVTNTYLGLNVVLALQQLVLAIWLIARGFRESPAA
jgi:hypothetical protein